jgi:hypothetical protein
MEYACIHRGGPVTSYVAYAYSLHPRYFKFLLDFLLVTHCLFRKAIFIFANVSHRYFLSEIIIYGINLSNVEQNQFTGFHISFRIIS